MLNQNSYTSSFRLFLLKVILQLILLLSISGFMFARMFEKYIILGSQSNGAYKINRIINQNNKDEIPVLGSSRAENAFVPSLLGKNYFNYGLSGTKYDVTLFFIEQECLKEKSKPELIINLDYESFEKNIGDISNYLYNADRPEVKALLGDKYKFYFGVPFLKYFGQYEGYLKGYINDRIAFTKVPDNGAMLEKNKLPEKQFQSLVIQRLSGKYTFNPDTAIFNRMVAIVNKNPDRRFIFVISPYHSSFFKSFVNKGVADSFMRRLYTLKNVTLIDFGKRDYPDSLYLNTSHLNYIGAVRFSYELKDTLYKLGM